VSNTQPAVEDRLEELTAALQSEPPTEVADEIVDAPETTKTKLVEFCRVEQGLTQLRDLVSSTNYDITTTAGDKVARKLRQTCVAIRARTKDVYDINNRPLLERGRALRAMRDHIVGEVEKLEAPLDAAIKAQEQAKEAERQRKAEIEQQRVAGIRTKINALAAIPTGSVLMKADQIAAEVEAVNAMAIDEQGFQEFFVEACELRESVLAQLKHLFGAAEMREAQERRLAEERAQLERERAAAAAEAERQAEQARVDRERVEAEARRVGGLRARVTDISRIALQAAAMDVAELRAVMATLNSIDISEASFQELAADAAQTRAAVMTDLQRLLDAATARGVEAAERAREAQEARERQAREQAELQAQRDAFEAERRAAEEKVAADVAEMQRQRYEIEAERRALLAAKVPAEPELPATVEAPEPAPTELAAAAPAQVELLAPRPSDLEIARVLSSTYQVGLLQVVDWLATIDIASLFPAAEAFVGDAPPEAP
jgi:colicin import membrane protein